VAAAVAVSIGFGAVLTYTSTSLLQAGGQQEAFAGLVRWSPSPSSPG